MAVFTVTTTADAVDPNDGRLSLREAVAQANATAAADRVQFAAGIEGGTLTLTGGELVLRRDVAIDGDRDDDGVGVTLSGGDAQRILRISGAGTDVALEDLILTDGQVEGAARGGAVLVGGGGGLSLDGCTVRDSRSGYDGAGGGLFAERGSRVTVERSSFEGNAQGGLYVPGGAIAADGAELVVRHSTFTGNVGGSGGGAIALGGGSRLELEDSRITGNGRVGGDAPTTGGGVRLVDSTGTIARTTFADNIANFGGAISLSDSRVVVLDSTVAANIAAHEGFYSPKGGGIFAVGDADAVVRNSTITGNTARIDDPAGTSYNAFGGGIYAATSARLDIANSIVVGNATVNGGGPLGLGPDVFGVVNISNGHNVFGSVLGAVAGDRTGVTAGAVFAALDPATGGGLLSDSGIVPLRDSLDNPALSGADPLAVSPFGQLGGTARPQPSGSRPDIGAIEIGQPLSTTATADNDVIAGTGGADAVNALAGNDLVRGRGGDDRLIGGEGSDLLDGGAGDDRLDGETGIDLVSYASGTRAVAIDLRGATGTAERGDETDTLVGIEGAIGSARGDSFTGDGAGNYFQGGLGRDTFIGGDGRDLYDVDAVAESRPGGTNRDLIADFVPLVDDIDLVRVDADATVAGDQSFRWVGATALTGPAQVGFFTSGGDTIVRASTDDDDDAELQIQLAGIKTLTADDFYL